ALAEEPGELGGERVPRREVSALLELVDPLLEILDIRRSFLVRGDRLADLLLVAPGRLLELLDVDPDTDQVAQPLAEGDRAARARGQRDVMGHRGPEARRRNPGPLARVVEDADDP